MIYLHAWLRRAKTIKIDLFASSGVNPIGIDELMTIPQGATYPSNLRRAKVDLPGPKLCISLACLKSLQLSQICLNFVGCRTFPCWLLNFPLPEMSAIRPVCSWFWARFCSATNLHDYFLAEAYATHLHTTYRSSDCEVNLRGDSVVSTQTFLCEKGACSVKWC